MHKILKAYLKRLTNLTSTNKSLLLLTLPTEQFIDLHELDYLNGKPSFDIIQQLIAAKPSISLCDWQDSRFDRVNEASKKLKKIARTAAFIEEERGAQDLYVGYPMVKGKFSDGTLVRCPLLFFPVQLVLRHNQWILQPRENEAIGFNQSFLLAYSYFTGISISDEWLERDFDDLSKDSLVFRTQLYELLKQSPLEINFNQDSFTDKLKAFDRFKKADFEEEERNGEIKLYTEAVLGIFPQAGSFLVPDYRQLISTYEGASVDDFFYSQTLGSALSGQSIREENTITPLALDASQEQAIIRIKSGQSVVVQGPPGTGKSQLICNLIADYTARGKKVLLVCQKRAALDVVYNRLKEVGMEEFVALVHDVKHDRKVLYEQMASQIEKVDAYKRQNQTLDAIYLERSFAQVSRKIDKLSADLEEFRKALFDDTACGLSVKELYLSSDPSAPFIHLKKEYKQLPATTWLGFQSQLSQYQLYARKLNQEEYIWKNRVSFHDFQHSDLAELTDIITSIPVNVQSIINQAEKITGMKWSIEYVEYFDADSDKITNLISSLRTQTQWSIFERILAGKSHKEVDIKWLNNREKKLLKCLKGEGIDKSLSTESLESFSQILKDARKARNNWFAWTYWKWFSKDKKQVARVAESNHLELTKEDLKVLAQRVQNRRATEELIVRLNKVWPASELYEEAHVRMWFTDQRQALKAKKILEKTTFLQHHSLLLKGNFNDFQKKIYQLFTVVSEWQTMNKAWRSYLTAEQIEKIRTDAGFANKLVAALEEDFDTLCELDKIKHGFSTAEQEVVVKLQTHPVKVETGTAAAEKDLVQLFDNSIRLAWIEHIESQFPVLRAVSTQKLSQLEKDLQDSMQQKKELSREVLLMKLREQTYRDIEFNRLNNRITYRDLKHQVTKKRNIWQLRKLLSSFQEEIFQLVPCWMASPESVSAIFDLHKQFDLVIFDEASQCFAERGIPAMYRGKQIVVTGDSKQLSPSDLYRIRFEEEAEEIPDLEVDSLLDLTARYFPQIQLSGHYRSRTLELIDFSNRHFYKGSLQMLPNFEVMNRKEPAIRYLKVEGFWQDNTNETEAIEVVRLVLDLIRQQPDKEMGIVTFNFRQQQLIQDLLEEKALEEHVLLPHSLFIKNIENVQGDERDIIIFSVGYAPDAKGRLVMQFGSLNQQGGENRLNVAVTRAREQVYVVSSILPGQLQTDNTANPGPKLLKAYLSYAWQVSQGEYTPQPREVENAPSTQWLKDKVLQQNSEAVKELPFADLTIKRNGQYESLILTDDDLYYQSFSAKDAHAYTPFLLKQKNWPFKRLYSREYWKAKKTTASKEL